MSKAFRCDKCGKFFDGDPDMQLKFLMGIKYSPENGDKAQFYLKDLCPECCKSFCAWWSGKVSEVSLAGAIV